MTREACATEGCRNQAVPRSIWCSTCLWRRRHNKPMDAPRRHRKGQRRTPRELVTAAAQALADAEDEERAWHRLRVAMNRYQLAKGWTPPKRTAEYVDG